MNRWADYIAAMPLYERCLVAHDNPENTPLIDRAVEKARMQLRWDVGAIIASAHDRVDAILRAK